MNPAALGFDTSNYTTSAALFDGAGVRSARRLLDVPDGALGLRQSDALFAHVKRLPDLIARLAQDGMDGIAVVGASCTPRPVEGSYMPCFLAGESQGRTLASILGVPFFPCSHQEGHLAAAAWSADCPEVLDAPFLAWHLSGGTTELLHVTPAGSRLHAVQIGGSADLSAGQLIDRTGKLLGLPFPAGRALDELSGTSDKENHVTVKVAQSTFSLSGMENQAAKHWETHQNPAATARFVLESLADAVVRATKQAQEVYRDIPLLCAGGVAANRILRTRMAACNARFAAPEYSTDNAVGTAILAHRWRMREGEAVGA